MTRRAAPRLELLQGTLDLLISCARFSSDLRMGTPLASTSGKRLKISSKLKRARSTRRSIAWKRVA